MVACAGGAASAFCKTQPNSKPKRHVKEAEKNVNVFLFLICRMHADAVEVDQFIAPILKTRQIISSIV
ncbi:phosphatidylinositol kinase [Corchorus olitorius]|uniref:Phosphatidylinositol kinase n=1 Tax=Corchorus olitorius TaxID=93759 RepID=A0A1R3J739_9ROSI|nr:phosphatidylinositol kinase [Corchorus olitorius]